ncbi:MAG: hypothetical protein JWR15_905 [Prosthecobacter sp.]|nr:hypothetical protein [Prosthecobacter sp.]
MLHLLACVFCLALLGSTQVVGKDKDETHMTYPSKVEGSKGKEREKLFTAWMSSDVLRTYTDEKRAKGEQIIYFEYDNARSQTRAIYTSKLKLKGPYSRWSYTNEKDMDAKLNSEIKLGLQPAFIVCNTSGAYTMLLVSPEDMDAVRAELKVLGVGEPKLRK